jgi:hypothetical protein
MLETNTLLVKCQRCGAWPMAANLPKPASAHREPRLRCPKCQHQEERLAPPPGRHAARAAPAARSRRGVSPLKIRSHSESHIVELEDGSRWQIYPSDLDLTLSWKPDAELTVMPSYDEISSHTLVGGGVNVRAILAGESWPVAEVRAARRKDD